MSNSYQPGDFPGHGISGQSPTSYFNDDVDNETSEMGGMNPNTIGLEAASTLATHDGAEAAGKIGRFSPGFVRVFRHDGV